MKDEASRLAVTRYHERTKHRPGRFARSLGYLDWHTQPNPFRWYDGCERIPLQREEPAATDPGFDELCAGVSAAPLDRRSLSQLLYDSLAISAWKQHGTSRWSLRCNPSSGNLHPTEAYVIQPTGRELPAGVYHYAPLFHALERRAALSGELDRKLARLLQGDGFHAAPIVTSVEQRGRATDLTAAHGREAERRGRSASLASWPPDDLCTDRRPLGAGFGRRPDQNEGRIRGLGRRLRAHQG